MAATFTHRVDITINVDGRSTSYSYTYNIADIEELQHMECDRYPSGAPDVMVGKTNVNAAMYMAFCHNVAAPANVYAEDLGAPATLQSKYLENGDVLILHNSDAGGCFNSSATLTTSTFVTADRMKATAQRYELKVDLIALYE